MARRDPADIVALLDDARHLRDSVLVLVGRLEAYAQQVRDATRDDEQEGDDDHGRGS